MANVLQFIIRAKDEASKQLKGINISLGGVMETALGFSLANIGGMVAGEFKEMIGAAAQLEGVGYAFESLAEDAGRSGDEFLVELKEMSGGMIATGDLMKMANQAMLLSGRTVADKLPQYMKIAQASARATGQSFDYMFQSLITGIGRQSKLIIDNLGLTVSMSKANEVYAKSLGKTVKQLTEGERKQAFMNEVLRAGDDLIERVGDSGETTAMKMAQVNVTISEAKTAFGEMLLPVIGEVAGAFLDLRDGIRETVKEIKLLEDETYAGAKTAEEYAKTIIEARDDTERYAGSLGGARYAARLMGLEQEYLTRQTEELIEEAAALTEGFTYLDHGIRQVAEGADEAVDGVDDLTGTLEGVKKQADGTLVVMKGLGKTMSQLGYDLPPITEFWPEADISAVQENIQTLIQTTTDARIIGAQQALAVESTSYEQSLAGAEAMVEQTATALEWARGRVEETAAGMWGPHGAYQPGAMVRESLEEYVTAHQIAQEKVENLEKAHQERVAGLISGYEVAVANTTDPALQNMQKYLADVEELNRIKGESAARLLEDAMLPSLAQMLAESVLMHETSWADIDTAMWESVKAEMDGLYDVGVAHDDVGLKIAAHEGKIGTLETKVGTAMPTMAEKIEEGAEKPWDEATDSADDYLRKIRLIDGEHIHVYIHQHIVGEDIPGLEP